MSAEYVDVQVRMPADLHAKVIARAQRHAIAPTAVITVAVERDFQAPAVAPAAMPDELMSATEVCRKLRISIWTLRRRARKAGDPIRLAKSRLGKQKPMQFVRSKIEAMERGQ